MITEALMTLAASLVSFVFGLVPVPEVPDFLAAVPGYFDALAPYLSGTDAWIPWSLLMAVIAAAAAALLTGIGIRLVRIVASFLTLGGGA